MTQNLDLSTHPLETVEKLTISQRNVTLEQMQQLDHLLGRDGRKYRIKSNKEMSKTIQMGMLKLQPKL